MSDINKEFINAYGEKLDLEIDALIAEANENPHVFSKEFEDRMQELISTGSSPAQKAKRARARRIAFIAVAAVLALAAAACAVPEIRESIAGFFVRVFSDHVEYTDPAVTKERIEEEYGLVPIPEGFTVTNTEKTRFGYSVTYTDTHQNTIVLMQAANGVTSSFVDTAQGNSREYVIGGKTVIIHHSDEYAQASWLENGYYFSLSYTSPVDLSTFESWIDSVQIRK